jgi:hypothetical protein
VGHRDNRTRISSPAKVLDAVKLVRTGIVVSLAPLSLKWWRLMSTPPCSATTNAITDQTTDNYQVSYHGQTVAHMDTWCHFFENGQMYNGIPVKDNITAEAGCKKGSVMNWKDGVFTRAVLYDIAQLKGADWVEPGVPIRRADLEAWEKSG